MKAPLLTISDGVAAGIREDPSGRRSPTARGGGPRGRLARRGADERDLIAAELRRLCDDDVADLVLSTGGTGFAPRDVTPEATLEVLERLSPGIDQALRADSLARFPHGMLSRGVSGTRRQTFVINLPGSPKACAEGFAVLQPVLDTRSALLRAEPTTHPEAAQP